MINNKVAQLTTDITNAFCDNLKKKKKVTPYRMSVPYTINYIGVEDKPRTRHEAKFPKWETSNWD